MSDGIEPELDGMWCANRPDINVVKVIVSLFHVIARVVQDPDITRFGRLTLVTEYDDPGIRVRARTCNVSGLDSQYPRHLRSPRIAVHGFLGVASRLT